MRATCWAGSSRATSPGSASTCTYGWSARRSPPSAARARLGEGDPCGAPAGRPHPSRLHRLRTPAPGGLLPSLPPCARCPRSTRSVPELSDRYGAPPASVEVLLSMAPLPDRCPRGGGRRGPGAGQDDPFRASRGPGLRRDEDEAPPPGNGAQARHPAGAGAAADRHRAWAAPSCATTELLDRAREILRTLVPAAAEQITSRTSAQ